MPLPALAWSPRTKTSNEVQVWANLGLGIIEYTKVLYDAPVGLQSAAFNCCGGACTCPLNSFVATRTINRNSGAVGTLPVAAPLYSAIEGDHDPIVVGDMVQQICLPNPEDDFLICFDQGAVSSPGMPYRAIPVKFNSVDHYVRQREDNTITLNDIYVSNRRGLQRIMGIPVTIIIKTTPEGSGIFQDIQYYSNVILSPSPMNSGSDGNASIDISMEGPFAFSAIFAASPTVASPLQDP
jgi:hypothetical protein